MEVLSVGRERPRCVQRKAEAHTAHRQKAEDRVGLRLLGTARVSENQPVVGLPLFVGNVNVLLGSVDKRWKSVSTYLLV